MMETDKESAKEEPLFTLRRFHISEDFGFLHPCPLKELPPFYQPWMEITNQLSYLIENHQLRSWVDKMPLLSTEHLRGHQELALAHMALSFITMGYIWQEGEKGTVKVLPRNVAVPFAEISQTLGLPPILVHMDFVLVNWKKKDPSGPLDIENLEPIICSPGGDSTKAFILVTFLVEKAAAPGIKAVVKAINSLLQPNNRILEEALQELAKAMKDMLVMIKKMHDYVDPDIFYAITRLFFSGWKENPVLPGGLTYEGVCEQPQEYSGASAAQSTTLQSFDELLGIHHSEESSAFLHGMRAYMPPHHRSFIQEIRDGPSLRWYILSSGCKELFETYNQCVAALVDLRTYHVAIVTKFITIAGVNARTRNGLAMRPASFLEGKGTGGSPTGALHFLKNVRDTTKEALLKF